jgi:hypothetical protein
VNSEAVMRAESRWQAVPNWLVRPAGSVYPPIWLMERSGRMKST